MNILLKKRWAISFYKQQYRIETTRLQNRDYGTNGWYFITIKTRNSNEYFGAINNSIMKLSTIGRIANDIWNMIPDQFPYVKLDEMIIMPDHMHGILHIQNENNSDKSNITGDAINRVSTNTKNQLIMKNRGGITGNKNPMLSNNLSRVIRWYKGRVKYETTKMNLEFHWHSRFHDRILRIENDELNIKRNYIQNNPTKWKSDM